MWGALGILRIRRYIKLGDSGWERKIIFAIYIGLIVDGEDVIRADAPFFF